MPALTKILKSIDRLSEWSGQTGKWAALLLVLVGTAPEGRGLDDVVVEADVRQAEPAPDEEAVLEDLLDLAGRGVGADVKVLGRAAEEQVAHAAAHEVGGEALAHEPVHDLEGVGMDVLPGNGVF